MASKMYDPTQEEWCLNTPVTPRRAYLEHPTTTFHKIPSVCEGHNNACANPPTRIAVNNGHITGYCDSCMLDDLLQARTIRATKGAW